MYIYYDFCIRKNQEKNEYNQKVFDSVDVCFIMVNQKTSKILVLRFFKHSMTPPFFLVQAL